MKVKRRAVMTSGFIDPSTTYRKPKKPTGKALKRAIKKQQMERELNERYWRTH